MLRQRRNYLTKRKRVTRKHGKREADIRYRKYWRDNERFADLFNTVAFQGEVKINPEDLREVDTNVSALIQVAELERSIERTRDVMKISNGMKYLLLGVENQQYIHYGMPLRTLIYDVLGYIDEAKRISEKRRKEKGLTNAEFLSGMKKEDKLTPIITIIIYYGEEPWDGPLTLSDMFDEEVQKSGLCQTEHRMILLEVRESEEYHFTNQETETIFSISRELLRGNVDKVKKKYGTQDLSQEILSMIGSITRFRGMEKIVEKGEMNMCKALDAMLEQERIKTEERMCKGLQDAIDKERRETEERMCKGIQDALDKERRETENRIRKLEEESIKTFVQVLKEFQCETQEIYQRLQKKYNLSYDEAKLYV